MKTGTGAGPVWVNLRAYPANFNHNPPPAYHLPHPISRPCALLIADDSSLGAGLRLLIRCCVCSTWYIYDLWGFQVQRNMFNSALSGTGFFTLQLSGQGPVAFGGALLGLE